MKRVTSSVKTAPGERRIRLAAPDVGPLDAALARLADVLGRDALTNASETARFEAEAAETLEVAECVAVSSCTVGLMLVERCLGLRGEAVVPSFTFFATAHGLLWNGVKPALADSDPETFQLDPASAARALGAGTSAIIGVHLYGAAAPVSELEALAEARGLRLLFDGAHALGTSVGGRSVAAYGDATVYSLSPTKALTTGEGGLIATRRPELARELRKARNYGRGETYDCDLLGLNARMTEIQAALGRLGLGRLDAIVERRRELASRYERALAGAPGVRLQRIPAGTASGRKDFAVWFADSSARAAAEAALERRGVETRRYFHPPLHRQRLYRRFYRPERERLEVAERLSAGMLCLPLHTRLDFDDIDYVAETIHRALEAQTAA